MCIYPCAYQGYVPKSRTAIRGVLCLIGVCRIRRQRDRVGDWVRSGTQIEKCGNGRVGDMGGNVGASVRLHWCLMLSVPLCLSRIILDVLPSPLVLDATQPDTDPTRRFTVMLVHTSGGILYTELRADYSDATRLAFGSVCCGCTRIFGMDIGEKREY